MASALSAERAHPTRMRGETRRNQIVAVAAELFASRGFSGTTTLRFRLSAAGRVVVSLRRPFGARALAAFTVAGRRGANAVRVPRSATGRLLGPGRYVVVAETSARRLGEASTVVRRTP